MCEIKNVAKLLWYPVNIAQAENIINNLEWEIMEKLTFFLIAIHDKLSINDSVLNDIKHDNNLSCNRHELAITAVEEESFAVLW